MIPLRATVRLQLHAGFDFAAAEAQVPYFAALGISHLYLSPIATASEGSTHGYDNVDPTCISPALGGEAGFIALATAARAAGMGILLDIVPNHMAAEPANAWWSDVLRHGHRSRHAAWFDIDWRAEGCEGRLWLPVLDRPLDQAIAEGVLQVCVDEQGPWLQHHDLRVPLSPLSYPLQAASWPEWTRRCNRSPERLHAVLERQAYRLAWWRTAADRVNYRRFFDINGLAALRVERADVFDAVHALPLRLVAQGWVDGLRIDHVDGLADPAAYLRRLRAALDVAGSARGLPPGALSLHVEKILADDESLPAGWACDGTTGYDFMDQVGALLHDPSGAAPLQRTWAALSGSAATFDEVQRAARLEMLDGSLQVDRARCLRAITACLADASSGNDLTPAMFDRALVAMLCHFPVYRTYGLHDGDDQRYLQRAVTAAHEALDGAARIALAHLRDWLLDTAVDSPGAAARAALRIRVEQLAAPLNAKAVEDTAFYRYGRLLSRNEVGSDPGHFALAPQRFVERARQRGQRYPRAMLAVATHDHKRGPDARLRLAVLASRPTAWRDALPRWHRLAAEAGCPSPLPAAHTAMLMQSLLASWPLQRDADPAAYAERISAWLTKALREGKQLSRWSDPDTELEAAATSWVSWLLQDDAASLLREDLRAFAGTLEVPAARLGLVQLALQLCCPGIPDLYQGNEGWDTSLVDPDNRRPVDYTERAAWLQDDRAWGVLLSEWRDGAPKARLLACLLQARREHPEVFLQAPLAAMEVAGDWLLLTRIFEGQALLLLVRLRADVGAAQAEDHSAGLAQSDDDHAATLLTLPGVPRGRYRSVLAGSVLTLGDAGVELRGLHEGSPVALWIKEAGDGGG